MSSQDGPDIGSRALDARFVRGAGPVAEVEFKAFFLLGLDEVIARDGPMGVEELVGDVGHDRGAAGGDAAFGDEDEEAGEKLVDVDAGAELGEFGEEFGGEAFRVVLDVHRKGSGGGCLRVAEAKARVSWRAGEAAALAVGIEISTARSGGLWRCGDRITGGAGTDSCCAHELFLFFGEEGGTYTSLCGNCVALVNFW